MTPEAILRECQRRDIVLRVVGDRLQIDAPRGSVDPYLLQALTEQKRPLLSLLRSLQNAPADAWVCAFCGQPGDYWWEVCGKSLCVCKGCCDQRKEHSFTSAWNEAEASKSS